MHTFSPSVDVALTAILFDGEKHIQKWRRMPLMATQYVFIRRATPSAGTTVSGVRKYSSDIPSTARLHLRLSCAAQTCHCKGEGIRPVEIRCFISFFLGGQLFKTNRCIISNFFLVYVIHVRFSMGQNLNGRLSKVGFPHRNYNNVTDCSNNHAGGTSPYQHTVCPVASYLLDAGHIGGDASARYVDGIFARHGRGRSGCRCRCRGGAIGLQQQHTLEWLSKGNIIMASNSNPSCKCTAISNMLTYGA